MDKVGERKRTVGDISRELILKDKKITHSPAEQMASQLDKFEENVFKCVKENIKTFPEDFYVVVLTKKEKLMQNVIRNYFYGRLSCPTPNYDQIVYKYHKKEDKLDFLWVIPDKETSKYMVANTAKVDPSQWGLLQNVLKFADGSLFRLAKELNGEEEKTSILKDN